MPADIDNLLTPKQATDLLGKSRCQVWRYGRDGTLRSVVLAGKRFYPLQGSDQGPQLRSTSGLIYPIPKSKGLRTFNTRLVAQNDVRCNFLAPYQKGGKFPPKINRSYSIPSKAV